MAAWSYHWGGFGPIFDKIGSRPVYDLFRHVDPAFQMDRFKQDVLMLRAGNDESMVPDSTRDYYDKMAKNQRVSSFESAVLGQIIEHVIEHVINSVEAEYPTRTLY